ncbi:hypothetical protein CEQ90_00075 [Lewinellaceae bacterium SD302]|nr:hypothetical protein CEQ90_00075 [Lewinellaceae bacterium SD302]
MSNFGKSCFLPFVVFLSLLLSFPVAMNAQSDTWLGEEIKLKSQTISLADALQLLIDNGVSISYRSDRLPEQQISIRGKKRSIASWLNFFLVDTDLIYESIGKEKSLVIFPDPEIVGYERTLYGQVFDAASGERLILANINLQNRKQGISTNEDGRYSVSLAGGMLDVSVSYIGYQTKVFQLVLRKDSLLNIALKPSLSLQEITVTANSTSMIGVSPDAGGIRIGVEEAEQLSGLGGEADPLSIVSLLPGVTTGADGVGGINIRGSDASHNLILLDGVPVYNLNHAAGLFSIFNSQAIRRVDLYKNGMPARFGGRLSGVLDVHTRDGNLFRNEVRVSQSLLASRLTVEGPLVPKESSYLISGRYFWAGALVPGISRNYKARQGRDGEAAYDLYDVNFKLNQRLGKTDRLYFSFYKGADILVNEAEKRQQITDLTGGGGVIVNDLTQTNRQEISWGNTVGALRWNHIFDESLFANISLTYSNLGLSAGFDRRDSIEVNNSLRSNSLATGIFKSDIRQIGLSFDGQWLPRVGREIRFGTQLNFHSFTPLLVSSRSRDILGAEFQLPVAKTHQPIEANAFAAYVIRKPGLQFRAGLRAQLWSTGKGNRYLNFSPRLLYTRRIAPGLSWQTTFDASTQAVHLLSSFTLGLPADIWVPSTENLRPARAYQFSTGLRWQVKQAWELELSGYSKQMEGLVEYRPSEDLEGDWEGQLSVGRGLASGLELSIRKTEGKIRGWVSYTLAKTNRTFDEEINEGETFPFRYDRLHSVSTLLSWYPGPRSSLSLSWRFGTGAAYSLSLNDLGAFLIDDSGNPLGQFGSRNSFRLPSVHRLDLNYRFELRRKASSPYTHTFNIGVYNAYDRRNEIYYELRKEFVQIDGQLDEKRSFVKVFISRLLPIFSYQLHFRGKPHVKPDLR